MPQIFHFKKIGMESVTFDDDYDKYVLLSEYKKLKEQNEMLIKSSESIMNSDGSRIRELQKDFFKIQEKYLNLQKKLEDVIDDKKNLNKEFLKKYGKKKDKPYRESIVIDQDTAELLKRIDINNYSKFIPLLKIVGIILEKCIDIYDDELKEYRHKIFEDSNGNLWKFTQSRSGYIMSLFETYAYEQIIYS